VQVSLAGNPTPTVVGQLQLATFLNDAGLEATGNNLFMESAASGPATAANPAAPGYGVVMQGYTEASNVDPVSEITNLIIAQRAYEMNSKVVTTADQMLSTANNTKS
jgi:flagellar basal-body rod protein FlgG